MATVSVCLLLAACSDDKGGDTGPKPLTGGCTVLEPTEVATVLGTSAFAAPVKGSTACTVTVADNRVAQIQTSPKIGSDHFAALTASGTTVSPPPAPASAAAWVEGAMPSSSRLVALVGSTLLEVDVVTGKGEAADRKVALALARSVIKRLPPSRPIGDEESITRVEESCAAYTPDVVEEIGGEGAVANPTVPAGSCEIVTDDGFSSGVISLVAEDADVAQVTEASPSVATGEGKPVELPRTEVDLGDAAVFIASTPDGGDGTLLVIKDGVLRSVSVVVGSPDLDPVSFAVDIASVLLDR